MLRIWPPFFESKIGQNNPENRRTLRYARGLMRLIGSLGDEHKARVFSHS